MKKALLYLCIASTITYGSYCSALAEEHPAAPSAPSVHPTPVRPAVDVVPFNAQKDAMKQIKNEGLVNDFFKIITYTGDPIKASPNSGDSSKKYEEANRKYAQGNITAAYRDYKDLLDLSRKNDFLNLGLAYKFANLGLFSLSQHAISNIENKDLYGNQITLIQKKLYPKITLTYDEEIYLAQNYTEIYFNNLAFEIVREMGKKSELTKKSDYANYILAQAYMNIKEYNKAINAVNKAISINSDNANYYKLKAQIYAENNKFSDATKTLEHLDEKEISILTYKNDIDALRNFVLAKSTKDRTKTKYYLANYFIKNGDTDRAVKELNQNIFSDKKDFKSLSMLGDIYFDKSEYGKASEYYEKSFKIKKNYPETLEGLGNISFYKQEYKPALDYYTKASKKDKKDAVVLVKAAYCRKMLNQKEKAIELASKALSIDDESADVYYVMSKIYEDQNEKYLKKALSINPMYADAWLDLTEIAIKNSNIALAQTYLYPVKYMNENSYKYKYFVNILKRKDSLYQDTMSDAQKQTNQNPL